MIAKGYTMDLYCRNEGLPVWYGDAADTPKGHHPPNYSGTYFGESRREVEGYARKGGWVFSEGDVICPYCAGKR